MSSYLLSVLAQRHRAHDLDIFVTANPWDWLVWEAGAQALALAARDGSTAQVTVGRGKSCDLVINDGTLSSLHLVYMRGPRGWTVRDAGSRNGSVFGGAKLEPGVPRLLRSGDRVEAGSVTLTLYEAAGLLERLRTL